MMADPRHKNKDNASCKDKLHPTLDTWTALTPRPVPVSGWNAALYRDRCMTIVCGLSGMITGGLSATPPMNVYTAATHGRAMRER